MSELRHQYLSNNNIAKFSVTITSSNGITNLSSSSCRKDTKLRSKTSICSALIFESRASSYSVICDVFLLTAETDRNALQLFLGFNADPVRIHCRELVDFAIHISSFA